MTNEYYYLAENVTDCRNIRRDFLNSINQLQIELNYVGCIITEDGMVPSTSKMQAITQMSTVENMKQLE